MPHVNVRGAIIRSVVIGNARDVLQGLAITCLGSGTPVTIVAYLVCGFRALKSLSVGQAPAQIRSKNTPVSFQIYT